MPGAYKCRNLAVLWAVLLQTQNGTVLSHKDKQQHGFPALLPCQEATYYLTAAPDLVAQAKHWPGGSLCCLYAARSHCLLHHSCQHLKLWTKAVYTQVHVLCCVQAAAHQQEVQRLHRQFASLLQDTLGQMRAKLEEEYSTACGST